MNCNTVPHSHQQNFIRHFKRNWRHSEGVYLFVEKRWSSKCQFPEWDLPEEETTAVNVAQLTLNETQHQFNLSSVLKNGLILLQKYILNVAQFLWPKRSLTEAFASTKSSWCVKTRLAFKSLLLDLLNALPRCVDQMMWHSCWCQTSDTARDAHAQICLNVTCWTRRCSSDLTGLCVPPLKIWIWFFCKLTLNACLWIFYSVSAFKSHQPLSRNWLTSYFVEANWAKNWVKCKFESALVLRLHLT